MIVVVRGRNLLQKILKFAETASMFVVIMVVAFDIETTGLDPYKSKIVLIGIKRKGRIKQWKLWEVSDELVVIKRCLWDLAKVPDYEETIVGYNNLKFDVPFVTVRLTVLDKMTTEIHRTLYSKKWLDLYQYLGNDYRRLSTWLKRFGIKGRYEEIRGSRVPKLYETVDTRR